MPDETKPADTTNQPGQNSVDNTGVDQTTPTNSDFKNTPAYQAMAKQLAEMQAREKAREEADAKAKSEAEKKRLESEGKYQEALALREKEIEEIKARHQADILQRDLKNALLEAKATNPVFIAGAISGYKDGDIGEYVKSLAADESNKQFFGDAPAPRTLPTPPGAPAAAGTGFTGEIKTVDDYKKALKSDDPKVKSAAVRWGMNFLNGQNYQ
jgi:hypothetical protein